MPKDFDDLKPGVELTCSHINRIYREIRRWRNFQGDGIIGVDGADGDQPPTIAYYGTGGGGFLTPADSGAGFASGSRGSPSSATVTLMVSNGSTGFTTTGGTTTTAYSTFSAAIGANKTIWLGQVADGGAYYVIQVDC